MRDFVYIPEEDALQDQLIRSMTDHMLGFSKEEKATLTEILKNLFKVYHETKVQGYKVNDKCIDAMKALDNFLGRSPRRYEHMNGRDIRSYIEDDWAMLTCYGFSYPDTEKTKSGLIQFKKELIGEKLQTYNSLYDWKFEFLFKSYVLKRDITMLSWAPGFIINTCSGLGGKYISDNYVAELESYVKTYQDSYKAVNSGLDKLSKYADIISEHEDRLNIPKSSIHEQFDELELKFNEAADATGTYNGNKFSLAARSTIIKLQGLALEPLEKRYTELSDFSKKISEKIDTLEKADGYNPIDPELIESLKKSITEFSKDINYRSLKVNDTIFQMLKFDNEKYGFNAGEKEIIDSAKNKCQEYENLLNLVKQKTDELKEKCEEKNKEIEAGEVEEEEIEDEENDLKRDYTQVDLDYLDTSFLRNHEVDEFGEIIDTAEKVYDPEKSDYWYGLSYTLDKEMYAFESNAENKLLPSKKIEEFIYCHGKSQMLFDQIPDDKKEVGRGGLYQEMQDEIDMVSKLSERIGKTNTCQDKRKEFFEVSEIIKDTQNRGLFANHDLFNGMTAALDQYKEAFANPNAYMEQELRDIAQDTKKACLLYLNKHLGSDKNNQSIGGQGSDDGIIRKQAVVRMLELMTELPEFTKQDVPAKTAGLKVDFKDLNFSQLKNSLAENSVTREGTLDERSYGNLNRAKAAKKEVKNFKINM